MKVLFISHSHENTAFSFSAHDYVKAMLSAGIEVVCRHIKLNNTTPKVPDFIKECEQKEVKDITHVIQYLLPHHLSYIPDVKNIAICLHDLNTLKYIQWDRSLNCMDEVWLPHAWSKFDGEISVKTRYVPIPCDISVYEKEYEELDIVGTGGTYKFYTIADLNIRKNIRDTIIAFNNEFHTNEPVSLIIKSGTQGMAPQESANIISTSIAEIKRDMKLYPKVENYHQEIIITHHLDVDAIWKLHTTCDCLINTSRAQAWSMPMFDALAFGNKAIYYRFENSNYTFVNNKNVYPVDCKSTPCFGYNDTFFELGSSREDWADSNIKGLQAEMRKAYNNGFNKPKVKLEDYKEFSYEAVGKTIKRIL